MPLPYENAAAGNAVADAYWEIVESYRAENAELRAAWAKVRAEIELTSMPIKGGGAYAKGWSEAKAQDAAILDQHAPKED